MVSRNPLGSTQRHLTEHPYPAYYPSYRLDYYWNIVDSNPGMQPWMPGFASGRMHYFELLLRRELPARQALEREQDWETKVLSTIRLFQSITSARSPRESKDFDQTTGLLSKKVPEFTELWQKASLLKRRDISSELAAGPTVVGTTFLPCPFAEDIRLRFSCVASILPRASSPGSRKIGEAYYANAFVPEDETTRMAVELMAQCGVDKLRELFRRTPNLPALLEELRYPEITAGQIDGLLAGPYPAWYLNPRAEVRAANQMAFWLWGRNLIGANVFTIIVRPDILKRVPPAHNAEFFGKKSSVFKRIETSLAPSVRDYFVSTMGSDPDLRALFEQSAYLSQNEWGSAREWEYTLKIVGPGLLYPEGLLEFGVTVSRLVGDAGFLAVYKPAKQSDLSISLINYEYTRCKSLENVLEYVVYDTDRGDILIKEQEQERHARLVGLAEDSRMPFDPEVVLFVDESEESQKARHLLESAGEKYRTLSASGPDIPAGVCGGVVFAKTKGVQDLIASLKSFDAAADAAIDRLIPYLYGGRRAPDSRRQKRRAKEVGNERLKPMP